MFENLFILACVLFVLFFFGWCLWATSPNRPERLAKLREDWGPKPRGTKTRTSPH